MQFPNRCMKALFSRCYALYDFYNNYDLSFIHILKWNNHWKSEDCFTKGKLQCAVIQLVYMCCASTFCVFFSFLSKYMFTFPFTCIFICELPVYTGNFNLKCVSGVPVKNNLGLNRPLLVFLLWQYRANSYVTV